MDRVVMEGYIERLAREVSHSGTIGSATKTRLAANLAKDERSQLLRSDVDFAVKHLTSLSPAPEEFLNTFEELKKAKPAEVGNFVALLSKIANSPGIYAEISSPTASLAIENEGKSGNVMPAARAPPKLSMPFTRGGAQPNVLSPASSDESSAARLAREQATPRLSMAQQLRQKPPSLELDSPLLDTIISMPAGPAALQGAGEAQYPNPLFMESRALPSPQTTLRHDPLYMPTLLAHGKQHVPEQSAAAPVVTLPDAGCLFEPMPVVIAESAPRHLQERVLDRNMPAWDAERPFLSGDCLLDCARKCSSTDAPARALAGLSEVEQEQLLINDLLYAIAGKEGDYIGVREARGPGGNTHLLFCLTTPCSHYLQEQLRRMLPIAECVVLLQRYVESRLRFEFGAVCHAFAAAVRGVLDDWILMVAQLEHQMLCGKLTLQAMWFYCQPALNVLELTAGLCAEASRRKLTGAALLDLLHLKASRLAGDVVACHLVQRLLHAATVPYFVMLTRWVSEGVLEDPYDEFMIVEDASMGTESAIDGQSAYWLRRHALRLSAASAASGADAQVDVPGILQAHAKLVLAAGRYLNVLRESGKAVQRAAGMEQVVDYDPQGRYLHSITAYYNRASAALLDMMLNDFGLVSWLNSIKHFFFLDQGDFLNNFLDNADAELHKRANQASQPRLRSLLELAVRTSSVNSDAHHERVSLELDPTYFSQLHGDVFGIKREKEAHEGAQTALEQDIAKANGNLKAVELLMLSFEVPWPLNLVVPPAMMRKYQLIFKHLIQLRYVERSLAQTWQQLQKTRLLRLKPTEPLDVPAIDVLRSAHSLCHRMMFFVQQYLRFMTVEVLEPQWHEMLCGIAAAPSLDEVIELHSTCLRKALQGCLLARMKTLAEVAAISLSARVFCDHLQDGFLRHTAPPPASARFQEGFMNGKASHAPESAEAKLANVRAISSDRKFRSTMAKLEHDFDKAHGNLVKELRIQKKAIMKDGDMAATGDLSDEADSIGNFINQIVFKLSNLPSGLTLSALD